MCDLLRRRAQLVRRRTAQILSNQNLISRNTGKGISTNDFRMLDADEIGRASGANAARGLAIESNLAVLRFLDERARGLERAFHT